MQAIMKTEKKQHQKVTRGELFQFDAIDNAEIPGIQPSSYMRMRCVLQLWNKTISNYSTSTLIIICCLPFPLYIYILVHTAREPTGCCCFTFPMLLHSTTIHLHTNEQSHINNVYGVQALQYLKHEIKELLFLQLVPHTLPNSINNSESHK